MVFPAALYLLAVAPPSLAHGWGTTIATDTAFAVALVVLLGDRVPVDLRVFLTAAVIVDDLVAIAVVALFYSAELRVDYLAASAAVTALLVGLNAAGIHRITVCSNGIKLAKDEAFVEKLASYGARIALSFDTFDPHTDKLMQGAHLLDIKLETLRLLDKHGVDCTLIPVMTRGVNEHEVGKILEFGLARPSVRHIEVHTMTFTGQSGTSFQATVTRSFDCSWRWRRLCDASMPYGTILMSFSSTSRIVGPSPREASFSMPTTRLKRLARNTTFQPR